MIKTYYAVRKGRKSNIVVKSWSECERLVKGYPGAIFKGFGLYQKEEAYKFAESGDYGKHTPKAKPQRSESAKHRKDAKKYPCIERKSYRDPITGIYYKNRCIRRSGPRVIGINYVESTDTSCPF